MYTHKSNTYSSSILANRISIRVYLVNLLCVFAHAKLLNYLYKQNFSILSFQVSGPKLHLRTDRLEQTGLSAISQLSFNRSTDRSTGFVIICCSTGFAIRSFYRYSGRLQICRNILLTLCSYFIINSVQSGRSAEDGPTDMTNFPGSVTNDLESTS